MNQNVADTYFNKVVPFQIPHKIVYPYIKWEVKKRPGSI